MKLSDYGQFWKLLYALYALEDHRMQFGALAGDRGGISVVLLLK
jgi:hypothetical protein